MPERPLVLFGKPEDADRFKKKGGDFSKPYLPSYTRQKERLLPQFQELQSALERGALEIQDNPDGIDPEYTLIFEAYGELNSFYSAIRYLQKIYPELELCFETDKEDISPDNDFHFLKNEVPDNEKPLTFKFFCILANQRALQEILSLWNNYSTNQNYKFPFGSSGLKDIFKTLKSVHLWGIEERFIETGAKQAWEEDLSNPDIQNIKCEIELSFRHSSNTKRNEAENKVINNINAIGGRVLDKSCIPEIAYHAILVEIPRQAIQEILSNQEITFLSFNEILFVNPSGQSLVSASTEAIDFDGELQNPPIINNEPIVALFDGLPQENHPMLRDFILIEDPDDYTPAYEISHRQHGTAMASLIVWGELNNNPSAISRKIYVRPIMKPNPSIGNNAIESVPDNVLFVDKIHVAVRRLFEPQQDQPIPSIKAINLSIGIKNRPFYTFVSPLAKLLDYLSFKYKVLFIVSAGNYADDFDLGIPFADFVRLPDAEKDKIIINVMNRQSRNQKIISPAESINALTVGALFSDHSDYVQIGHNYLPSSDKIPGIYSALGRGINHSIKPDLLMEGGRNVINENFPNHNIARWNSISLKTNPPGILHAKPTNPTGKNVGYTYGTSNSAAILSHNAVKCYDVLDDVFTSERGEGVPSEYASLMLKAMLVHGATWDETSEFIGHTLEMATRGDYGDKIHKFIGYGVPNIERVKECTKNRITLIGYGDLAKEKAHVYEIPLPFAFSSKKMLRSLTVSMAYFSPISPNTKKYKQADVWFNLEEGEDLLPNRMDVNHYAVRRGTLQHERFSGDGIIGWISNRTLNLKVNYREAIKNSEQFIPYAIFITFEIAPKYDIDVYTAITEKIRTRGRIPVPIAN